MKRIRLEIKFAVIGLILSLVFISHAYSIAVYDYLSDAKITFNRPWDDATPIVTSTTSGMGQYSAETATSKDFDIEEFWYYQASFITGSAGDADLSQGGISHAENSVETFFNFNFGDTPTDLRVTLNDFNQNLESYRQLDLWEPLNQTGEYIGYWPELGGGGTALGLKFDGEWFAIPAWASGGSTTFYNLVGQHEIILYTQASETAIAEYPYVKASEPATMLLLGTGLFGLLGLGIKNWRFYPPDYRR